MGISPLRNLTVALTCMSFVVALLSLGGEMTPWTQMSFTATSAEVDFGPNITGSGTTPHAFSVSIGVLKSTVCDIECEIQKTPTFGKSCDRIGKTVVFFVAAGLAVSLGSVLLVVFSALKRGLSSAMLFLSALLYAAALLAWATGCHNDIKSKYDGFANFSCEFAIGFGAVVAASVGSVASMVFLCFSAD